MHQAEPLQYAELVSSERRHKNILLPAEIPLHSDVFRSDFAYSPEFADQVAKAIPTELTRDISDIERILGRKLNLKITPEGIAYDSPHSMLYEFEMFHHRADPERKTIDVGCGAANIAMDAREDRRIVHDVSEFTKHPMGTERLSQYALSQEDGKAQNVFWYIHNISDGILPLQLYFRDFAIVFNNLGLERL